MNPRLSLVPEPAPDPVAEAAAALALARAERGERLLDVLAELLGLATAICADTGDLPGRREGARKLLTLADPVRLTQTALDGRQP